VYCSTDVIRLAAPGIAAACQLRSDRPETERAVKPTGGIALVAIAPHAPAHFDGVRAVRDQREVRQLEVVGGVVRISHAVATRDERTGNVKRRNLVAGRRAVVAIVLKRVSLTACGLSTESSVIIRFCPLPLVL